ncbi:MAG: hypothetical protein J7L82_04495 [Staphylothermus sp.]|nr:hypothetical protein [Staphylothermus sp.]
MRFCPKCNGLMIPVKRCHQYYLSCTRCGYEEEAEDSIIYRYRLKGRSKKRVITSRPISTVKHDSDIELLNLIREETREIRDRILLKVMS